MEIFITATLGNIFNLLLLRAPRLGRNRSCRYFYSGHYFCLFPVFGFPSIVRFSWKTAESLLEEKGLKVEFEEFEPDEDPSVKNNPSIKNFFVTSNDKKENKNPKNSRSDFFKDLKLETATFDGFVKRN